MIKRFFVFAAIIMAFSVVLPAQNPKKVAVMETKKANSDVTDFQATMVRGGMEAAVANASGYIGYDRTAFDAIMREHNFQRSGAVNEAQIRQLGKIAGVQYIIVPEAAGSGNEFYIIVKMLDVETGQFGGVYEELCGPTGTDIKNACARLGTKLFGGKVPANTVTSSGNGVFSVSATKKVYFSKGNLQYQASTNTWRFAEHQWDYIGNDNSNISSYYSDWIDLFGWGTGNNPTKTSIGGSNYSSFYDWGNHGISNGGGKSWRTLTSNEWVYVFNSRSTNSGIRYAKAVVGGVNGMILLPDNWNSSTYSLSNTNNGDAAFDSNRISQSEWTSILEANGAVFLPAAGNRGGTSVYNVGSSGRYWSSTAYGTDSAYGVYFSSGWVPPQDYDDRYDGRSVRLVRVVE